MAKKSILRTVLWIAEFISIVVVGYIARTLTASYPLAGLICIALAMIYLAVMNWKKFVVWLKEFIRKSIVSLKRNPGIIPLLMLAISFLFYSLNLTDVSDTTAKIQSKGMGLSEFCIMLFSLLIMLCTLNAFPIRKKPNWVMVGLVVVMAAIIIYCDSHYITAIIKANTRAENPIVITDATIYIYDALKMLKTHRILMGISTALVVLEPVYSMLLKKINTAVEIEDNSSMGAIEIND